MFKFDYDHNYIYDIGHHLNSKYSVSSMVNSKHILSYLFHSYYVYLKCCAYKFKCGNAEVIQGHIPLRS